MINKAVFKLSTLFLLSGVFNFSYGQACSDVFFSEYIEGGATSNKALEIYNSSYSIVDLSTYSIKLYGNGSTTPGVTIALSGMLGRDSVYVVANPAADATILAQTDLTDAGLTYNGNDAIILFNGTDTVDIIGVVGQNPGVSWTGGGLSTASQVLSRKFVVSMGVKNNPSVFNPSGEWIGYAATDFSYIGNYQGSCHSSCANDYVAIADSICPGDSLLFAGVYRSTAGVYVDSLTNSGGCDSIVTLTLSIKNCGVNGGDCNELFISEYTEGTGSNQALEIYNPTANPIGLNGYEFKIYQNGATFPAVIIPLSGTIQPKRTHLVVNVSASTVYTNNAQQMFGTLGFDGNDAIVLFKGTDTVDIFGRIGENPGTMGWGSLTQDRVLVRKPAIKSGVVNNPSVFSPSTDWLINANGDTSDIGIHTSSCDTCTTVYGYDSATICMGDSVFFAGSYRKTSGFYLGIATLPNGCDSVVGFTLTVDSNTYAATIYDSICAGDSILFGLNYYSTPGTYYDTATVALSGCDSVTTLILTAKTNCAPPIDTTSCTELFFSEYIDGGGTNNRALEIFNPTSSPVNLAGYSIEAYGNGGTTPSITLPLSGIVAPYDVYVVANPSATDATLLTEKDTSSLVAQFNGNDAIVLKNGATQIDLIGIVGVDPVTAWTGGGVSTANQVMVRKIAVKHGVKTTPVSFDPSVEWIGYPSTDFSHIGSHTSECKCTPDSIIVYDSVCAGDSILFAGNYYSAVGTYFDTATNAIGCDSLTTLVLTAKTNCVASCVDVYDSITSTICNGDSVLFGGIYQSIAGSYKDTIQIAGGCDSIVTLQLSTVNTISASITNTICNGDSVLFGGIYRTIAGVYYDTAQTAGGCDSITTLTLGVGTSSVVTTIYDSICSGGSVVYGGVVYSTAGSFVDTLQNTTGCDSVLNITITLKSGNNITINDNVCPGDSVMYGGVYYKNPGTYVDTITSVTSCDTILTLNLTANAIVVPTIAIATTNNNVCAGQASQFTSTVVNGGTNPVYQWTVNGTNVAIGSTFNSSTGQLSSGDTVKCYVISSLSCAQPDTAYSNAIVMVVTGGSTDTIVDTICEGVTYTFGGNTMTTSGVYYDTVTNSSGCDSITMLKLQVNAAPIVVASSDKDTVSLNGTVSFVSAGSNAGNYTWDFGDGFSSTLPTVTHTFTTPGTYQVVLEGKGINGCDAYDTLTIFVKNNVGLNEYVNNKFVKVYPNPVNDKLTISTAGSKATFTTLQLFDVKGNLVKKLITGETNIVEMDMGSLVKGFYYLTVSGSQLYKNIKITKL